MDSSSSGWTLRYITDAEGNLPYFLSVLALSHPPLPLVQLPGGSHIDQYIQIPERTSLVYGGDLFDKKLTRVQENGDIRLAHILLNTKERFPDRVFLIIGNRDLNKMKFSSELDMSDIHRDIDEIAVPYWTEPEETVTFKAFLQEIILKEEALADKSMITKDHYRRYHTRVSRVKWLLKHTMGAEKAFENRRHELALIDGVDPTSISDERVADHFYESVASPHGIVRRYLLRAQLAYVWGNTIIVHGAVSARSLGFIPAESNRDALQSPADIKGRELAQTHSIQDWVDLLNEWCAEQLASWVAQPQWSPDRTSRGGTPLMGYGYGVAMDGRTVIVTDFLNDGNPKPPDAETVSLLNRSGISRVMFSGHKPWGDAPTTISLPTLEVLTCDQSYSDSTAPDRRGRAAAVVTLQGRLDYNAVTIQGTLSDGRGFDFTLPTWNGVERMAGKVAELIGLSTAGSWPWWVKTRLPDGRYRLSRGKHWRVFYVETDEPTLRAHLEDATWDWELPRPSSAL